MVCVFFCVETSHLKFHLQFLILLILVTRFFSWFQVFLDPRLLMIEHNFCSPPLELISQKSSVFSRSRSSLFSSASPQSHTTQDCSSTLLQNTIHRCTISWWVEPELQTVRNNCIWLLTFLIRITQFSVQFTCFVKNSSKYFHPVHNIYVLVFELKSGVEL